MSSRDQCKRIMVARLSPDMDANNGGGARWNQSLYLVRIEIMRAGPDVTEDRSNFLPLKRVSGRDKGKRWDNDFPGQSQGANHNLERDCRIAGRDAVANPDIIGQPLAKF